MNENINIDNDKSVKDSPRDEVRYADISGPGRGNRPKAHVMLRHYEQYSDGSSVEIQTVSFAKPIVQVFAHAGFTNVWLEFGSSDDVDLRMVWDMLSHYSRAENSVSYLPEEIERGTYTTEDGEAMVHFPVIELILSPIGRETEYQILGYNPAFYTLAPSSLKGEPCALQFTFPEDWFLVVNEMEPVDLARIHHEVTEEIKAERNFDRQG